MRRPSGVARRLDVSDRRHATSNTSSRISRTALSGSSSRSSTRARTSRSAGSSATAARRCALARLDATANTSPARFRRRRSSRRPSRSSVRPVLLERRPQLGDVLAAQSLGEEDRGTPVRLREGHDRPHLVEHRLRRRMIHLVDRDDVGDLHDPGLQRLDGVAGARHEHEQHGVRDPGHLDLALPRTHGLDEHDVLPRGVEQEHGLEGCLGEPAQVSARAHRADVDARIEEVVGEPDAVAEKRAARERARRDRPRPRPRFDPRRGCARRARRSGSTSRRPAGP